MHPIIAAPMTIDNLDQGIKQNDNIILHQGRVYGITMYYHLPVVHYEPLVITSIK